MTGSGTPGETAAVLSGSTPYPWPWDAAFTPQRCAFIVIDTDEPATPGGTPLWSTVDDIATHLTQAGAMVVEVRCRRPDRRRLPTSTARTSVPRLPFVAAHFASAGWDAFFGTALDSMLRSAGRDLLIFGGAWLEVGVHSSMRTANDRGYECLLLADACLPVSRHTGAAAISSVEMSGGIFGAVGSVVELHRLLSASPSTTSTTDSLPG